MLSHVFIDHPRLAIVLSIVVALSGALCLFRIPVEEYPEIAPTTIRISATYRGASAEVIAQTVAIPLEDEVNAVEDLLYYSSTCNNSGRYSCSVTFKSGTDSDMALVNLQNCVKRAGKCKPSVPVRFPLPPPWALHKTLCQPDHLRSIPQPPPPRRIAENKPEGLLTLREVFSCRGRGAGHRQAEWKAPPVQRSHGSASPDRGG